MLRQRLADGLVVAGTSAGATALGHAMILGGKGAEVSAAAVRTGPGLGLVPKSLIDMHFGERGRLPRLLSAVALDPDQLGIGIDENTAILVEGTCFEVLGTGVVTVVDAEDATVVHAATGTATRSPCSACGCTCCPPAACSTSSRGPRPSGPGTTGTDPEGTRCAALSLRRLSGPNVFTASPVSVARLELDELTGRETTDYPGLAGRLTRLLPGLAGPPLRGRAARRLPGRHGPRHLLRPRRPSTWPWSCPAWPAARSAWAARCGRVPTVTTT